MVTSDDPEMEALSPENNDEADVETEENNTDTSDHPDWAAP
jgi:hypothetical protein